jgi:hypothetical protein
LETNIYLHLGDKKRRISLFVVFGIGSNTRHASPQMANKAIMAISNSSILDFSGREGVGAEFKDFLRSRIHEQILSLRFLGIILRVIRLEISVWIS